MDMRETSDTESGTGRKVRLTRKLIAQYKRGMMLPSELTTQLILVWDRRALVLRCELLSEIIGFIF